MGLQEQTGLWFLQAGLPSTWALSFEERVQIRAANASTPQKLKSQYTKNMEKPHTHLTL